MSVTMGAVQLLLLVKGSYRRAEIRDGADRIPFSFAITQIVCRYYGATTHGVSVGLTAVIVETLGS